MPRKHVEKVPTQGFSAKANHLEMIKMLNYEGSFSGIQKNNHIPRPSSPIIVLNEDVIAISS